MYGEQSENRVVRAMSLEFLKNENTPKTRPKHAPSTRQARVLMLDPAGYCFDLRVIVLAGPFAKFSECVAIERASQDFRRTECARQNLGTWEPGNLGTWEPGNLGASQDFRRTECARQTGK